MYHDARFSTVCPNCGKKGWRKPERESPSEGEDRMQKVQFLPAIAAVLFLGLNPRAMAELALPEGPNRDFVMRTCTTCHDLGMVLSTGGRAREGWSNTLDD